MSMQDDIRAVERHSDDMEEWLNYRLRQIVEANNVGVAASVLMNLGTTMLAKAIILARDKERKIDVIQIIGKVLNAKVEEGEAAVQSLQAIEKAMHFTYGPDNGIRH